MTRIYSTATEQLALFPRAKAGAVDGHKNRGMGLEKALAQMHAVYAASGKAQINKQYLPTQPVKDGQWAKVIGRSTVDYTGVMAGGRMVAFDAKDCAGDKIELSRLQEHQREYLEEVDALGGWAFVLVRFGRGTVYRIPIMAWSHAIVAKCAPEARRLALDGWTPSGRAHIKAAELPEKWRIEGCDWYVEEELQV